MTKWKILVLELDGPSEAIGDFFKRKFEKETIIRKIDHAIRDKDRLTEEMKKAINDINADKIFTLYGDGRYHHYTYGLCRAIADARSEKYCYLHIDHHPDDADFCNSSSFWCGGFVNSILTGSNGKEARSIGSKLRCGEGIEETRMKITGVRRSMKKLLDNAPKDVYASMDLDVTAPKELVTSYGRGELRLPQLIKILDYLKTEKNLISADMLGYSMSCAHEKSLAFYETVARKIIG